MSQQVHSSSSIGSVLSKRGKVTATRSGQDMRILKRGDPIYADDTVGTVRGANLQLKMNDRNIVMLRGGSTFRVSLYNGVAHTHDGGGQRFEFTGGVLRPSRRHAASSTGLGIGG